jgi:hypothetical protein
LLGEFINNPYYTKSAVARGGSPQKNFEGNKKKYIINYFYIGFFFATFCREPRQAVEKTTLDLIYLSFLFATFSFQ